MTRGGLIAVAVVVGCVSVTSADFTNGGFESGDFTSWSTAGLASVETAAFGTGTTQGTHQALLDTFDNTASRSSLESFLGLGSGDLNTIASSLNAGDTVVEGSATKQTITVNAGDVLSFDWNMLTDEFMAQSMMNDFSFVSIVNAMTDVSVLSDIMTGSFVASSTSFGHETGFNSFSHTFTTGGTFTIGFGVVDVGGADYASGLIIDNVQIVPAPSAVALAFLGMPLAISFIRRRRPS